MLIARTLRNCSTSAVSCVATLIVGFLLQDLMLGVHPVLLTRDTVVYVEHSYRQSVCVAAVEVGVSGAAQLFLYALR